MKRLMQLENELIHALSKQLACTRLLIQAEAHEQSTASEMSVLKRECASLRDEVKDLLKQQAKRKVSTEAKFTGRTRAIQYCRRVSFVRRRQLCVSSHVEFTWPQD